VQVAVAPAQFQQFFVAALFNDPSLFQKQDPIGVHQAGQPMGHNQRHAIFGIFPNAHAAQIVALAKALKH
jgi:hypothetical protein